VNTNLYIKKTNLPLTKRRNNEGKNAKVLILNRSMTMRYIGVRLLIGAPKTEFVPACDVANSILGGRM
jgi:hypothetical protein